MRCFVVVLVHSPSFGFSLPWQFSVTCEFLISPWYLPPIFMFPIITLVFYKETQVSTLSGYHKPDGHLSLILNIIHMVILEMFCLKMFELFIALRFSYPRHRQPQMYEALFFGLFSLQCSPTSCLIWSPNFFYARSTCQSDVDETRA